MLLPHTSASAASRPNGDWEIESRDDSGHAKRMPALHHPMLGALRSNGKAVELARQTDREIADIDHLLDLAKSFQDDLANLDRNQPAEGILVGAKFLAKQPNELAALGRSHLSPRAEGCVCHFDFETASLGRVRFAGRVRLVRR